MVRFTKTLSSVDFAVKNNARIVTLNRPKESYFKFIAQIWFLIPAEISQKALNALNHDMVRKMRPQLAEWENQDFGCAIIKVLLCWRFMTSLAEYFTWVGTWTNSRIQKSITNSGKKTLNDVIKTLIVKMTS